MTLHLPDGYRVNPGIRSEKRAGHIFLGDEWTVIVTYNYRHAFELAKQYNMMTRTAVYSGRISHGQWQQFSTVKEAVRVMCAKHRIGVGSKLQHTGD